jgi:hypothetical protein
MLKSLEVETRSFPTSQNRDVGHPQLLIPGSPYEFGFTEFAYEQKAESPFARMAKGPHRRSTLCVEPTRPG